MKKQEPPDTEAGVNVMLLFLRVWAMTLYLPLRIRVGRDHCGFLGLFGLLWVFMYSGLFYAPEILVLLAILILHHFCLTVSRMIRDWRGVVEHTHYGGEPWIAMRLFFTEDEWLAKQIGEPIIIAALGFLFRTWWPNTATYFWWGATAMFFEHLMCEQVTRRAVDQLNNARIEAEYVMRRRR